MLRRAAVYLRISLDLTGEELAVERQREDALALAEAKGWEIHDYYVDNSVSASKKNVVRPEYQRMVKHYKAGKFNALICYDLDRLMRQPRELEDWIEEAETHGLPVVTMNGEADLGTDAGRLFARIKVSVAKAETDRKSARQKRAALQRAEMGRVPLGTRLTGYTKTGEVIPEEAKLVRFIFKEFSTNETLKGLAKKLNDAEISTRRGGTWSPSSVATILKNPRYAGRVVYKGQILDSKVPAWKPLVTEDTFDYVQSIFRRDERKKNSEGTARKHLGAGLYLCGVCLRPVQTNGPRYWCKEGGHVTRSLPAIDEHVLSTVRERLGKPDVAQMMVTETSHDAVKELSAEATELRHRLAVIEADYDNGDIDGPRFKAASEKVTNQLREVQAKRAALVAGNAVGDLLAASDPVAAFNNASVDQKREILRALVMVRLLPWPQGKKGFDKSSVLVLWKRTVFAGDDVEGLPDVPDAVSEALAS